MVFTVGHSVASEAGSVTSNPSGVDGSSSPAGFCDVQQNFDHLETFQSLSCSDIPNVDVFHDVTNEIQENSTFISIFSDLLRDILK